MGSSLFHMSNVLVYNAIALLFFGALNVYGKSSFSRAAFVASSPKTIPSIKKHQSLFATPSKVVDEDGPTPPPPYGEPDVVNVEDIPELHYDENAHPIPHQPWRRGMTLGCEDPIEAEWRQEAESLIKLAAKVVGGTVLDVTWFLTSVVITIDTESLDNVEMYDVGPPIQVRFPQPGPIYIDPEDPNPEVIWADEEEEEIELDPEEVEELEEARRKKQREKLFAEKSKEGIDDEDDDDEEDDEDDDDEDDDIPLYTSKAEQREEEEFVPEEEEIRLANLPTAFDARAIEVNTKALSTIADAILKSLEEEEDRLDVLERHEVILASPQENPYVLDTQTAFDKHIGDLVWVETQDPFESNRTLRGKLIDRNSMDVIINKKGRAVTIPLNFVKRVRVSPDSVDLEDYDEDEDEE